MQTPEESYQEARDYLDVTLLGTVFIFGYNAFSAILRGFGDSRRPLIFVSIACAINVALDLLFVGVYGMAAKGVYCIILYYYCQQYFAEDFLTKKSRKIRVNCSFTTLVKTTRQSFRRRNSRWCRRSSADVRKAAHTPAFRPFPAESYAGTVVVSTAEKYGTAAAPTSLSYGTAITNLPSGKDVTYTQIRKNSSPNRASCF